MSIQKLLPLARKMGEENFLAYKQYIKSVKAGESANLLLNLKNTTIIDTLSFTVRDGQKADINGFRNLLREIHKKYFPRASSSEAIKKVEMRHHVLEGENRITFISTETSDKKGIIGRSSYMFNRINNKLTTDVMTFCEDFSMNFFGIFNLKNNGIKDVQNTKINLSKGFKLEPNGERINLTIHPTATPEVPAFESHASISKEKFEKIFGGELEQSLPDLIKKSGIKLD